MNRSSPDYRLGVATRAGGPRGVAALAIAQFILGLGGFVALAAAAETPTAPAPAVSSTWLRCGGLWDGRGGKTQGATLIEVRGDRILSVRPPRPAPWHAAIFRLTCLPGLTDLGFVTLMVPIRLPPRATSNLSSSLPSIVRFWRP